MKKLIQICSVLTLVIAFSIISANAQSVQRYEAKVPFDFNINGKSYQAGDYVLRITTAPTGKILSVANDKRKLLQYSILNENGAVSKNNSQLKFTRYGDQWLLANIMTSEKGFSVPLSKSKKQLAKNQASDSKTEADAISIDLK